LQTSTDDDEVADSSTALSHGESSSEVDVTRAERDCVCSSTFRAGETEEGGENIGGGVDEKEDKDEHGVEDEEGAGDDILEDRVVSGGGGVPFGVRGDFAYSTSPRFRAKGSYRQFWREKMRRALLTPPAALIK